MSRCYPYPLPGYIKNGIRDEALIESTKIQREEQEAKKERKKEKREKKDKKREKKERDKARNSGEIDSKKHGHNKRHKDERSQEDQKGGDHQKGRENEAENFEKSSLTEEHGHAMGLGPQNSSDSTLNSNKRQKLSLPPDSGHNPGSIIRIRLPSQRHKDPEVLPSKEQPCSTSGRIDDALVQGMREHAPKRGRELEEHPCSTSSVRRPELAFNPSKEKPCSSSGASESLTHNAEASLPLNLCSSCSPTLALEFKNLVDDWVSPTLQSELTGFADDDWLFRKKQNHNISVESCKDGNVGVSQINSTTWPLASYLPEAGIYALPFVVPF